MASLSPQGILSLQLVHLGENTKKPTEVGFDKNSLIAT